MMETQGNLYDWFSRKGPVRQQNLCLLEDKGHNDQGNQRK